MGVSITTKDYIKTKEVVIDGMTWQYTQPGAGMSLELSRLAREATSETASPEEQTKMVETMFEYYSSLFKDTTKDNSEVTTWLRNTPIETIGAMVAYVNSHNE